MGESKDNNKTTTQPRWVKTAGILTTIGAGAGLGFAGGVLGTDAIFIENLKQDEQKAIAHVAQLPGSAEFSQAKRDALVKKRLAEREEELKEIKKEQVGRNRIIKTLTTTAGTGLGVFAVSRMGFMERRKREQEEKEKAGVQVS